MRVSTNMSDNNYSNKKCKQDVGIAEQESLPVPEKKTYPSDLIVFLDIDGTMICSKHNLSKAEMEVYKTELQATTDIDPTEEEKKGNDVHDGGICKSSLPMTQFSDDISNVVDVLQICGHP